jgi:hypothetical protein
MMVDDVVKITRKKYRHRINSNRIMDRSAPGLNMTLSDKGNALGLERQSVGESGGDTRHR